jgi:hypothetical protein
MIAPSGSVSLLRSPWSSSFLTLLNSVERDLLIACPFLKRSKAQQIISELERRGLRSTARVAVLTDLRPEAALSGALDLEAFTDFGANLPRFELTHLPSLHAKVYIADSRIAIVTSGNLTQSGLDGNLEYGVSFNDAPTVSEIRHDFEGYGTLGARVSVEDVAALASEVSELKRLYQKAERSMARRAKRAFAKQLDSTRIQLLRHRAKGKTTHAIFADTIRFLLAKAPLRTSELHPLIQGLHPDLCDDSIDRVIDGVHFGKKWKHYVRNAQQFLKRNGEIRFDGEKWHLVPHA